MKIDKIRDFLIMIKSIIVYVRSSPKRQAMFHALQAEHDSNKIPNHSDHFVQLDDA